MRVVVKLGGTLLDSADSRRRLAADLAAAALAMPELVIVHGGGKQVTRFLEERGVQSRFVDGLRVSTPEVVDALLKVVAGSVNQELVAALVAVGTGAVGLSGIDANLVQAERMRDDLGFVGRPTGGDPRLLELLTHHRYLPVVACVAGDGKGNVYNVNADQLAVACAASFRADRLLFLTDVDGVRSADGQVVPRLTPAGAEALIASGVATGGMQAKLTAACDGLARGIGRVVVAPGMASNAVGRLLAGESLGTEITKGDAQ